MKKEKSCGCVVIDEKNKVLLVKMRMGHWSFPKGHVEAGETEIETAKREVLEETNIKVKILEEFREVSTYSPAPGVEKDVVFFIAQPLNMNIEIQEEEVSEADFVPFNLAQNIITYKADLDILNKAIQYIKNKDD